MLALWNDWLFIAFLAPMFWALVNLIDVYFVDRVYENEYDGMVISGLFQGLPWISVLWLGFPVVEKEIAILAVLGGALFIASVCFYFKALFTANDAALIQTLFNLVPITVPILAFFIIGEKLTFLQYMGIIIVFFGVVILTFDKKIREKRIVKVGAMMSGAIIFLSLSMVISKEVYNHTSFWRGFLYFSLGSFLGGLVFYFLRRAKGNKSLIGLNKKYFGWFFGAEILALAGIFCSQKAISLAPAISMVAVIESFLPAFVLLFSAFLSFCAFFSAKKKKASEKMWEDQLIGLEVKLIAICIMATGIYLVNQ